MIRFILGLGCGLLLMWLWCNRAKLGFVIEHRKQIDAAGRLFDALGDLGVPGFGGAES